MGLYNRIGVDWQKSFTSSSNQSLFMLIVTMNQALSQSCLGEVRSCRGHRHNLRLRAFSYPESCLKMIRSPNPVAGRSADPHVRWEVRVGLGGGSTRLSLEMEHKQLSDSCRDAEGCLHLRITRFKMFVCLLRFIAQLPAQTRFNTSS